MHGQFGVRAPAKVPLVLLLLVTGTAVVGALRWPHRSVNALRASSWISDPVPHWFFQRRHAYGPHLLNACMHGPPYQCSDHTFTMMAQLQAVMTPPLSYLQCRNSARKCFCNYDATFAGNRCISSSYTN